MKLQRLRLTDLRWRTVSVTCASFVLIGRLLTCDKARSCGILRRARRASRDHQFGIREGVNVVEEAFMSNATRDLEWLGNGLGRLASLSEIALCSRLPACWLWPAFSSRFPANSIKPCCGENFMLSSLCFPLQSAHPNMEVPR